ncbi:hypothetical protein F5876DRAFT_68651 [Lentinula aff. lateritia]|uniref:Uncharacterized protein n=1 Tax=Lentinula aff. lateritia TaxID=2804960 RepID=A0ACC1TQ20_9AGAR|nr:hypothetical protein F5876DRAFT_68651 [Lentinula aff. lateritia]
MFIFSSSSSRSFRVTMHLLLAVTFLSVASSTSITPRAGPKQLPVWLGRVSQLRGNVRYHDVLGFSKKTPIQLGDMPVIFFGQHDVFWVDFDPTTTAMKLIPFPPNQIPLKGKGTSKVTLNSRLLVDLGLRIKFDDVGSRLWREKGLALISDAHFPQQIAQVLGRHSSDITLENDFDCFDILLDALHHVGVFKPSKASFKKYEEVKARFKAGVGIFQEVVPPANGKGMNAGKYILG